MKLDEITDDKSFMAFLYSMYLGRLANDGEVDDYYSCEISNQFMHADVRVTILKVPDAFEKKLMAEDLGVDIDKLLKEFRVLQSGEDSTKYENWHYQIFNAKERYEKDIARYEQKIKEFFGEHVGIVEFDVEQNRVKVKGYYNNPIPPKLIMEFCDKFGYYMPNYRRDDIKDSIFRHMIYIFHKKPVKE